jgi:cytochrome P450
VSALIEATVEGGRHLSNEELVGAIQILTFGGYSTTAHATCNIVIRLIEEPGLQQLLRDCSELIPAAVEEVMRLEPSVTSRHRRATQDVELGGRTIRRGERVLFNIIAANVDPEEWDHPDEFRLNRARNRVMTFGAGPHRCLGSTMARLLLTIVVQELLAHAKDIRWLDERREVRNSTSTAVWRGVESLYVAFEPFLI